MNEPTKTPWIQSTAGVLVVQGLIGPVVGAVVGVAATLALTRPVATDWSTLGLVALAVAVGIFALISVFARGLRALVWGNVGRLFKWLSAIRLTTKSRREAIEQRGYAKHEAEVAEQRAHTVQPRWHVQPRDAHGEHDLYWLTNRGGAATAVRLTADPEFFLLENEVYFHGFMASGGGGSEGQHFKGYPTDAGRAQGVTFHVTWRDANGDEQERDVEMPPADVVAGQEASRQEAYQQGRAVGRKEAMIEADAANAPQLPPPYPRWELRWVHNGDRHCTFTLRNSIPGSVVYRARIDINGFSHDEGDPAYWDDFTGPKTEKFSGHLSANGARKGFTVNLSWMNPQGEWSNLDWRMRGFEEDPNDVWNSTPF